MEEHVWDYRYGSDSNIVDVYIRYLRKKIDLGFDEKLIETVRGRGYRLRVME
nr:helix-turn-helix domain-containing protein [Halocella sp. SP3-1]